MKSAILLAIVIVTLSSLPIVSRRDAAAQENTFKANANLAHANQSAAVVPASGSVHARAGNTEPATSEPVQLEPVKPDAKTARAGDPVAANTKDKVRSADRAENAKDPLLTGHLQEGLSATAASK